MDKANRTRKHNICIRMNDAEYESFQKKLEETGQTKQDFILNAISGATIVTPETVEEIRQLNLQFTEATKLFRGVATNLNQVTRKVNLLAEIAQDKYPDPGHIYSIAASLPDPDFTEKLAKYVLDYRKEVEEIWLSLRSSVNPQKLMRVSEISSNTSSETTK